MAIALGHEEEGSHRNSDRVLGGGGNGSRKDLKNQKGSQHDEHLASHY